MVSCCHLLHSSLSKQANLPALSLLLTACHTEHTTSHITSVAECPLCSTPGMPKLMHYGLLFNVAGYKFDKHWHYGFDVNKCPPWDFSQNSMRRNAGLFEQPPHFSTLTTKVRQLEVLVAACKLLYLRAVPARDDHSAQLASCLHRK